MPLELGGSNDAANLRPEAGALPNPKDDVELALNRAVCDGQVSLPVTGDSVRAVPATGRTPGGRG